MIGERIAQYQLVARLGEGGMGVVYRAVDTRLGRPVAVKLVSDQFTRDADGQARLMREARMAAALNHPNICTIHDVLELEPTSGVEPGSHPGAAIVFELVEGETLASRIARTGALPIKELLDVAVQIADGLAAAHTRHIVHRDLKPQNVIVTSEGRVKILDFGLARLSSAAVPDPAVSTHTDFDVSRHAGAGATRGTVPYMSPEQAAGRPLDHRSDLFAFGIVLHEMATGERPFRGDTAVEILSKILEKEPPSLLASRPDLPASLERIARRCLQKRPDDRYQDTRDLLGAVREMQDSLRQTGAGPVLETIARDSGPAPTTIAEARGGRAKWLAAIGVAAGAIAIGVASVLMSTRGTPTTTSAPVHRQITFVDDASLPAISPDGAFVAFVRGEPWGELSATVAVPRAPQRVVIQDLAAGGRDLEVGECRPCYPPVWSPDGRSLLIPSASGSSIVPRLGGTPRRLEVRGQAAWNPDGTAIAHTVSERRGIGFVDVAGAEARVVPLRWTYLWIHGIAWAPRNEVAVLTADAAGQHAVWIVSPDGERQERIVEETRPIRSIRWAPDGRSLYYIRGGDADDLVAIPISATARPSGEPTVIVSGLAMGPQFAIGGNGRTLVYTRELRYANLWSAPLTSRSEKPAAPITTGTSVDQFPSVSPKGDTIAFVRTTGGVSNVFTVPVGGGAPQQLSFLAATNGAPAWSPDGGSLAVCAASKTGHVVVTFGLGKSAPRTFENTRCPNAGAETPVVWAPRREILYQRPGNRNYFVLDPETGAESPLVADESLGWIFAPLTSPDGTVIAAYWNRVLGGSPARAPGVWLLSQTGAPPIRISNGFHWPLGWSADGQTMFVYVPDRAEVAAVPGNGGVLRAIGVLGAARVGLAPALTPDRRTVIYSAHAIHADLWAMENFDPRRLR